MVGAKPDEQIRTPMQWSSEQGGGFTKGKPWESPQPDWAVTNVEAQERDAGSLLNHYRRLIQLRNNHPALNSGDIAVGSANMSWIAAFVRRSSAETIVVMINFGSLGLTPATVEFGISPILSGRFERIYADPSTGCSPELSATGINSLELRQIAPGGLCVYRRVPN